MNFFSNILGTNKSKASAATVTNSQTGTQSGGDSRPDGKVSFGYSLMRGKRQSMEDYYHAQFKKDPRTGEIVGCFGVFDGHGGPNAADFVRQNLFESLVKNSKFSTDIKTAFVEAFVDTDQKYLQADSGANRDDGCTAVTAVLVGQNLIVANVGDSRAVLSKGGQAYPLSEDHKPNRTDERQRIESAGGVVVWAGTWRVGGVLAVSRAFGDAKKTDAFLGGSVSTARAVASDRLLKRYVVAMPDLQEQQLSSQDDALILASDGLWDVLTNQDAAQCIKDIKDPQQAAKKLTDEAYGRGSNDNISCIVIRFNF